MDAVQSQHIRTLDRDYTLVNGDLNIKITESKHYILVIMFCGKDGM